MIHYQLTNMNRKIKKPFAKRKAKKGDTAVALYVVCILFFVTGCFSSCKQTSESGNILFTTIGKGYYGMVPTQENIIKTQDEWETLLSSLPKDAADLSETAIDFEKYQIIVVARSCPTGGWNVYVSSIKEYRFMIVVTVSVIVPTGYVSFILSRPFCIVKMPVTEKSIEFSYIYL